MGKEHRGCGGRQARPGRFRPVPHKEIARACGGYACPAFLPRPHQPGIRDSEGWARIFAIWSTETALQWHNFRHGAAAGGQRRLRHRTRTTSAWPAGRLTQVRLRLWIGGCVSGCRALGADTDRGRPMTRSASCSARAGARRPSDIAPASAASARWSTRFARRLRLRDGEKVAMGGQAWRVVVGSATRRACLCCPERKLFISLRDQVLPGISLTYPVFPPEGPSITAGRREGWPRWTRSSARCRTTMLVVFQREPATVRRLHRRIAALRTTSTARSTACGEALQNPGAPSTSIWRRCSPARHGRRQHADEPGHGARSLAT